MHFLGRDQKLTCTACQRCSLLTHVSWLQAGNNPDHFVVTGWQQQDLHQQQQMADAAPAGQRDQDQSPDKMMEDVVTSNMAGLSMANGHLHAARPETLSAAAAGEFM